MAPAFIAATPLVGKASPVSSNSCDQTRMSAKEVVDKYFPVYQRNRAPTIEIVGDTSVSMSMAPIEAYATVDKNEPPLLDYADPDAFVPKPTTPPSEISWPSGDGRGDPDFVGVSSAFDQPNLKQYGPFPDFFKIFSFEVENGLDEVRRLDETASGTSTDLCPYFFSPNGCTRGDRCQWRHARNDRLIVCKHYLRGLCKKRDRCDYLHSVDYDRMPECFFYSKFGECSNSECPYRHVDPEKKRNECPYYARGFCRHGPKCRLRHVTKTACHNYLAGFCKDGPDCQFGHARFEIPRTVDDDDVFNSGIDRFGFGRPRGPAPRLIELGNGVLATAAGTVPQAAGNHPTHQNWNR